MSYIGVQPTAGQYRQLDDISGSFNGTAVTFTTSVGGLNVTAGSAEQLLVSLGGVIQKPDSDYSVSTNSITFTTAPSSGLDFFAVLMGDAVNVGTPADGSVTSVKLASDLTVDLASGTVSAPSLTFDANSGLYSPGADEVAITTNGTEALRVDSSQRVGIGNTSPSANLELGTVGGSDQTLRLNSDGNGYLELSAEGSLNKLISGNAATGSASLSFEVSSGGTESEAARIDSDGRLLVGTTSGSNEPRLVVVGNQNNNNGSGWLALGRGEGAATITNNEGLGVISFTDNAQNEFARIQSDADAAAGSGDYPGRLVFSTTADAASSPTTALTINRNQELFTVPTYNGTTASAANVVVFSNGNLARSTSSIKYKTDVETLEDQYADNILACRPVWYRSTTSKDNPDYGYWGFIAEEVAEIDPRLVQWKTFEVTYDEKGSAVETPCDPEPEGVQYDRFVPHLLNLIKRQKEQIETQSAAIAALETRLTALEGGQAQ